MNLDNLNAVEECALTSCSSILGACDAVRQLAIDGDRSLDTALALAIRQVTWLMQRAIACKASGGHFPTVILSDTLHRCLEILDGKGGD